MDILIKNMEMPKDRKIFVIEPDGSVWVQIKDTSYFCTGSKAVALPPHGRLIDEDEFKASIHMNHLGKFATNRDVQVLYKLLNNAPVIVEATE